MTIMTDKEIASLIYRRRQQILVHSVLYYRMNENLIDDATWSRWALQLEELQAEYPEIAKKVPLYEEFKNFDHSTGSDLPLDNEWAINKARYLLYSRGEKNKQV